MQAIQQTQRESGHKKRGNQNGIYILEVRGEDVVQLLALVQLFARRGQVGAQLLHFAQSGL